MTARGATLAPLAGESGAPGRPRGNTLSPPASEAGKEGERPVIDVIIGSPGWSAEPGAEAIVRRAITAAADTIPGPKGEIAVLLTDDAAIRQLNRHWRKLDRPTNVLSFPAPPRPHAQKGRKQPAGVELPALLGDIVIAHETTAREAAAEGKPLSDHLAHLAVHGFLHLLGYDHESDVAAQDMERLETRILARLDLPDPYLMRDGA
jgi:probable rRNA maturation factor